MNLFLNEQGTHEYEKNIIMQNYENILQISLT